LYDPASANTRTARGTRPSLAAAKVYHLNDVADFPGDYFATEIGGTVDKLDKEGLWLKNTKGVTLHMRSSGGEGLELGIGVEGFKIKRK
jgi:hypothetical protein